MTTQSGSTLGLGAAARVAFLGYRRAAALDPVPALACELSTEHLGEHLLVVAPHPDDESIACGGLIASVLAAGGRATVLLVTAGDAYGRAALRLPDGAGDETGHGRSPERYLRLGGTRVSESREALRALGGDPIDMICLGYPDGALAEVVGSAAAPVRSRRTGADHVPYPFALSTGAPYTREALEADVVEVLSAISPSCVAFPDPRDRNADHVASSTIVASVLARSGADPVRLTYLTHSGHYPKPWAHLPEGCIRPPRKLSAAAVPFRSILLSEKARESKRAALRCYASQLAVPDMAVYLSSFDRRNELFVAAWG